MCNYFDTYIVIKRIITVEGANDGDKHNRSLTLKNNASFISCVSTINGTLTENAEDLDVVMPM